MTGPRQDADIIPATVVHGWWPRKDYDDRCHVWRCACKQAVVRQPFGAPVPRELNDHTRSFAKMGGERP